MSNTSKRIENLSPEKRALLEKKLKEKKLATSMRKSIPRRENPGVAPLSYAQQRLWFLNQLEPDSPFYNISQVFRIHGTINVESLHKALNAIINRHEILRTSFKLEGEQPVQVISTKLTLDLPTINISESPGKKRETRIQNLISDFTQQPFDLTCGPLILFHLIRIDSQEHIFVVVMHHIISDGWSMGIFNRELEALYNSFCSGEPYTPQELPIQYADFSQWQRQWFKGNVMENQLDYWRKQFKNVPSLLDLPIDHQRPLIQSFRGSKKSVLLSNELTRALKALSIKKNTTLFMTLLAAFQLLLFRYTGQKIIVTGSPIANRTISEIENLIGFFVNTLVFRADFSDNPTFSELLKQVRQVTLNAFENQDLPFEKLVEELQPERNLSYSPLFQVMFAFQNDSPVSLDLSNLTLTPVKVDYKSSKFDLTLFVSETDQGLRALMEYNTDLFNHDTIMRMLGNFQTLLENITKNPDCSISTIPILTKREQDQILLEWNNTKTEYPHDECIHQLFEMQVEKVPDAVAVVYEDDKLTYRELNERSNQLAHYLRKHGVGPDVLVGICMERSIDMIVGLLGILKAGGAYVPLDTSYPKERLKFMIDDSNLEILLTTNNLLKYIPDNNIKKICLDNEWNIISEYRMENVSNLTNMRNLAYVIYTSGSTGRPKGVCVLHQSINCLVINTNYIQFKSSDIIAQASNFSFDAATFEIWGALLNGASLVLISNDIILSPEEFATEIRRQGISVLFLTTALFNQMTREAPNAFRSVRYLLFGGETVDPSCVRMVVEAGPPQHLLHVYGPTECTTFTSWYQVKNIPKEAVTIPIGRPISNTTIYLLDRNLQPVPVGVVGEIYIGGDGIASEYLNRPDFSAEKFIPDPFINKAGSSLYRSGDLARYLPDGNIEFLGRKDNQVKIRGFRIELGEIEAVLDKYPGVNQVAVLAREDEPGKKRLVTYIVLEEGPKTSISVLRDFLKKKLPEYMIPSVFIKLDSLPLTPNGKVDRKALPIPDQKRPELEKEFVAPHTSVEKELAKIWCEVLRLQQIGIHDNFFESGGHSLLATQVMHRMRNISRENLPLALLFQYPTIAGLAKYLSRENVRPQPVVQDFYTLYPIQTYGTRAPFFWIHSQMITFLPNYLGQDQPLYAIIAQGVDGKRVRYKTMKEIIAHYLREIRTVQPAGPYFLGGFCWGGKYAFEIAQQLLGQGEEVGLLFVVEPALSPVRSRTFMDKLYPRFRRRRWKLSQLTLSGKIKYVFQAFYAKLRFPRIVSEVYLKTGRPMSPSLSVQYALDVILHTYGDFVQRTYPKEIVLIQAETGDHPIDSDWSSLAERGVKVHVAQASTHMDLLQEPGAGAWASWLDMYLRKAQAIYSDIEA
ncbi:MAG: non-ribosomal peptide synthetase [Planctomycetota bacterium]|jgi:amino acid adenylation domain-containing protein